MYYFIVNKTSGSGKTRKVWNEAAREMKRIGVEYKAYFTEYFGHAGELARMICDFPDEVIRLVVVGGDGTINEVLNGMHHFEKVQFGYLPTGSGNDFGRGMKIRGTTMENLHRILDCKETTPMDIGAVCWDGSEDRRYFAISSGVGVDADVCKQALHSGFKKVLNKLGLGSLIYLCLTLKTVFTMPSTDATVTFDYKEKREFNKMFFIVGMNQKFEGGGVPMAPCATPFDGKLSVCCVYGMSRWRALALLPCLVSGKHESKRGFEVIDCTEFELEIKRDMVLHADGEYCGEIRRARFTCLANKVNMLLCRETL